MSNLNTTKLVGNRILVKGTDAVGNEGQTILDSSQWDELVAAEAHAAAHEDFDATVNEFFEPLLKASEKLETAGAQVMDPTSYIVLDEGSEGQQARAPKILQLNRDTQILRIIEAGDSERLIWVGDDLEILAIEDVPPADLEQALGDITEALRGEADGSDS